MKRRLTKSLILTISAVLLAAFFNACTTPASPAASSSATTEQASTQLQRFWVTETHVKPEMMTQFREFVEKESLPAYQKAGYKQQSVYTTASLGESFEFITIRPIESLQQFDEPSFITKALGEEGARKWAAKRATMIVSAHSYVMQARPEMSIAPNPNETPKLVFVVRQSIAPGRSTDYENYIKNDVLPIIKKVSPKGFMFSKILNGGDTEMYISATFQDSFSDQEKWSAALLKEGYGNVVAKRAGIVMHRESAVYRYVPELSLRPEIVAEKK
jgi:antibiotic biosynthesis monooxygenase (ABM) superfamily enzyme